MRSRTRLAILQTVCVCWGTFVREGQPRFVQMRSSREITLKPCKSVLNTTPLFSMSVRYRYWLSRWCARLFR